jgi:hypothetical protein
MQKCMELRCKADGVAYVRAWLLFCAHHALLWYLRLDAEAAA